MMEDKQDMDEKKQRRDISDDDDNGGSDEEDYGPIMPPSGDMSEPETDEEAGAGDKSSRNNNYGQDDDDDDVQDDDDEDMDAADMIPLTQHISLIDHRRTVSAVSLDASGSRLVTGGRDCMVKLWDFHGMDTRFRPFRSIDEPCGGNPIRDIQFSPSGDSFLIASGSWQAKLYSREGSEMKEFSKGDPYLRDQRNTKGHVAGLTGCRWHPHERGIFFTASLDSTIRIWDVENRFENKQVVFVKSKERGGRTSVTAAAYSPDGNLIAAVGQDGALRLWNSKGPFISPTHSVESAHMSGSITSSINFDLTSKLLITRSSDDTLKLFDIRKLKSGALATAKGLPCLFEESNAIFSPNQKYVITGTSALKGSTEGSLCVFNAHDLTRAREDVSISGSVVRVLWHPKINQVIATTSEGAAHVYYDDRVSLAGAKLCAGKSLRARKIDEIPMTEPTVGLKIINPHALPMFREDQFPRKGKRKLEKLRNDPVATRKPEKPISGPGHGGRVGQSATQHMLKDIVKDDKRLEDPREAILRHAEAASKKPFWVDPAYKKTQPAPVMASAVFEDEEEERDAAKKKRPN